MATWWYATVGPFRLRFILFLLAIAIASGSAHAQSASSWLQIIALLACTIGTALMTMFFAPRKDTREAIGEAPDILPITGSPEDGIYWAGSNLTLDEACKHFVTVGATGSGKSLTLNLLLRSVVLKIPGKGQKQPPNAERCRALVYDAKLDLVNFVNGIKPDLEMHIMNPLDARFTPWDMAADVLSETDAHEFAAILLPRNPKENSPYFTDAARSLLAGVVKRFNADQAIKGTWTLRDVILACETTARLRSVLNHPETNYLQDHFAEANARNYAGVKSTLDNVLSILRPIAALMASAPNRALSLRKWATEKQSILILGNHESAREATDALNQVIMRMLSKILIARHGRITNEATWIFLDEIREAGQLHGLRQLLLRGRSKGVAVAMGFQDIKGMFAAYGDHEGAEIIGAAQNLVLLHINPSAPETAQWACNTFAARIGDVVTHGQSFGDKDSSNRNSHLGSLPNLIPLVLHSLPMPCPKAGLEFYAYSNATGYSKRHYNWAQHLTRWKVVGCKDSGEPDFKVNTTRDADRLKAWTSEECTKFGALREISPQKSTHPIDDAKSAIAAMERSKR